MAVFEVDEDQFIDIQAPLKSCGFLSDETTDPGLGAAAQRLQEAEIKIVPHRADLITRITSPQKLLINLDCFPPCTRKLGAIF